MELVINLVVILAWVVMWTLGTAYKLTWRVAHLVTKGVIALLAHRRRQAEEAAVMRGAEPQPMGCVPELPSDRFDPADVIYQVVAFPRGFTARVYVYKKRGEVRRVMSTIDRTLARQLEYAILSSRIELPPLSLKDHSMEDILRDTEVKGAAAIQKALEDIRKVRPFELPVQAFVPALAIQQEADAGLPPKAASVPAAVAAMPVAAAEVPGLKVSARTARKGEPITGVVLAAAETEAIFVGDGKKGGSKGKTFEVTLESSAGEASMRGVVLREEFARLGVKPGDRVSITPMGRRKVVDGDIDKGYMKNMFDVQLLERGCAA